jgi:Mg-chelatase subunit ChlD
MVIIDTEATDVKLEINKTLAEASNAIYHHISSMNRENIRHVLEVEGLVKKNK